MVERTLPEPPEQPERLDLRSQDIAGDKVAELLELFPEVRTEDGKFDLDRLKLVVGESIDVGKERYGLTWPGKAECFKTIQAPSLGTLLPVPEESVNWDTTENLIIEGDNLEVLKLLQKSYLGKVKMIYIDPPYNTGNDFIYPDDYSESLKTYLEYTGQVDGEGRRFSTNTDTDGRFHSKWLNMMYPRLYLARHLLRDDGIICISIDDNEMHHLRELCDDIFGEENFVGSVTVKMSHLSGVKMSHTAARLPKLKEYLVAYSRSRAAYALNAVRVPTTWDDAFERYTSWLDFDNRDDLATWRRRRLTDVLSDVKAADLEQFRLNHSDRIFRTAVNDSLATTPRDDRFRRSVTPTGLERIALNGEEVIFASSKLTVIDGKQVPTTALGDIWMDIGINNLHNEGGVAFPNGKKPLKLLRRLIQLVVASGEDRPLILDFFAGSGTTGEAVLQENDGDGGSRRFVLVQLPEPAGTGSVTDILKTRLTHAAAQSATRGPANDAGFRVFKLAESSFDVWEGQQPRQLSALIEQLELHVDNVRNDRSADDVLFELLLKSGYPLSTSVEALTVHGKRVFSVADGAFLVCLDRGLSLELLRDVAQRKPERFVVLDEGFAGNDQLKANAVQIFKAADVTFRTV